jgi:predicted nucleic acid-binding protein
MALVIDAPTVAACAFLEEHVNVELTLARVVTEEALARRHRLTVYDAAYLELALKRTCR